MNDITQVHVVAQGEEVVGTGGSVETRVCFNYGAWISRGGAEAFCKRLNRNKGADEGEYYTLSLNVRP